MKYLIGILALCSLAACKNDDNNGSPDQPAIPAPRNITYSILSTFPHDTGSYTQGLVFYKGELYEGTGLENRSKLMRTDLQTGKALQSLTLPPEIFGEGITILNDTVYQLTYKNNKVFVYTLPGFKKIKEYSVNMEGWGLTNDGKNLILTNGSGDLYFYDPAGFRLLRTQTVTEAGSPTFNLNELEFINGYVYANQYTYPYIFKINPETGVIEGKVDLSQLWDRIRQKRPEIHPSDLVPNGIAWDSVAKKMYITGKLWPELFEIQLSE